jgi:nitroimidazol reductase NimA-like FMN-containing flavoprotein (pyridoxamine 5'-phosphate oxidase superfamily)
MNSVIKKFLNDNLYLTLATVCRSGRPWSTPLFFAYDNNYIYWWSPKDAVHSQNIARDENVFITIFDSHVPEGEGSGLYLDCAAQELRGGVA